MRKCRLTVHIGHGLDPSGAAMRRGRVLLSEMQELSRKRQTKNGSFSFEKLAAEPTRYSTSAAP